MSVTVVLVLDTRRPKKTKRYPIKLRVTFNRKPQYYQTVFDLHQDDWDKLTATRITEDLQKTRKTLKDIERSATNVAEKMFVFSFSDFEQRCIAGNEWFRQRNKKAKHGDVVLKDDFDFSPYLKRFAILRESDPKLLTLTWAYLSYIKRLIRHDRIGSAVSYHCSYVSLKSFKGNVSLVSINADFLIAYEKHSKSRDLSRSTIGIYLRPLRAVFNDVISRQFLDKESHYPFGPQRYRIPTARKAKKALELGDVQKIYYYRCDSLTSREQMAKDYWLFSYFANGMNPKDIACLRWENLSGDYITFERAKTEWVHREDPLTITVYVNDEMRAIIERWANPDRSPKNYIFPVLQHGLSAMRIYDRIHDFVGFINYWMKEILANLKIEKSATTYVARHTFSTVLKRSGTSTEFIKEALGHANLETTEGYLDDFEKTTKKEIAGRLTAFKEGVSKDGSYL